jgi:DNA invertase Pin-like site-specific DNA recombinase
MMAKSKFVSYLRVSTVRQGASGLGLEAQRAAVAGYLSGGDWTPVQEVPEVESGDRQAGSPRRNVAFISNLMRSGILIEIKNLLPM